MIVVPDTIGLTDVQQEILELKEEKNAVILVHNYQVNEIQEIGDFVGDSLGLAYHARDADADLILFCGVHFMAETAKIVNPRKKVILPDVDAGCSLAESCDPKELAAYKEAHPDVYVVSYINCTAEVKALSDVICTSGNAVKIVEQIPKDRQILFAPDQNLGEWVIQQTGRQMDLWEGSCYIHIEFTHQSIMEIREEYPDAPVVAHPECERAVRMLADEVCSTEKMVHYCRDHESNQFIIATEEGMLNRLRRELPEKEFIPGPTARCACAECRFMKMNTIEKVRDALKFEEPELVMDSELRKKAAIPLERMLEWSQR